MATIEILGINNCAAYNEIIKVKTRLKEVSVGKYKSYVLIL